ncbi:hypothetical protein IWQ62_004956 [Dispira parvispora]|uniref:Uncharacterized protein n=1 Tax=Dispira parvispora TaxID=1520584 RepID=A0A9W8AKX2_9FUNG|nr:hypothetical protein IWQ62_004956 [Dispira parvispora]
MQTLVNGCMALGSHGQRCALRPLFLSVKPSASRGLQAPFGRYQPLFCRGVHNHVTGSTPRRRLQTDKSSSVRDSTKPRPSYPSELRSSASPTKKPKMRGFIPARFQLEAIPNEGRASNLTHGSKDASKIPSFIELGLSPSLVTALMESVGILGRPTSQSSSEAVLPTEIQALAIPELLRRGDPKFVGPGSPHVLCAAETGSGKTLAYLLPIMHHLKRQEEEAQRQAEASLENQDVTNLAHTAVSPTVAVRKLRHPRALVLVPSRELVDQVVTTCKALSHAVKFRCLGVTYNLARRQLRTQLEASPVDLVVATPSMFFEYQQEGLFSVADLRYVVVDEADTMLNDAGFDQVTTQILQIVNHASQKADRMLQCTMVSATLPKTVVQAIDQLFASKKGSVAPFVKITTPHLHQALPRIRHTFLYPDNYRGSKNLHLLTILREIPQARVLIFCNTKQAAVELTCFLKNRDIPTLTLHGDIRDPKERRAIVQEFTNRDTRPVSTRVKGTVSRVPKLLVCTDIASRGLDTLGVTHVILYEFPTTAIDYLHRAGRTGRCGQKGQIISFVENRDRNLADRIRRATREHSVIQ